MFGHRADGHLIKEIDPIIALTPYLMPMRCDAQVFSDYKLDFEKLARYIVAKAIRSHSWRSSSQPMCALYHSCPS